MKNRALLLGFLKLLLKLQKSDCHYSQFLESTFELLQQFEIQMVESSFYYHVFPGDLHEWQITCLRCKNRISKPSDLNETLRMVPITILHHLSLATSDTDSYYIPVLFSSHDRFMDVRDMFYRDGHHLVCPCCQNIRIHDDSIDAEIKPNVAPILNLCEAIKMDLHFSSTKNISAVDKMLLNTRTMMEVMCFSTMTVETKIYLDFFLFGQENGTKSITEADEDVVYWNKENGNKKHKKRGQIEFLRKNNIRTNPQGLSVMEMLPPDIESLSLFEAIIAFGHNEFFKNRVRLMESLSIILFRSSSKKSPKSDHAYFDRYAPMLDLNDDEVKRFMKSRYDQFRQQELGSIQYGLHKTLLREHDVFTLGVCSSYRPMQLSLGSLPTMSSILCTVDKGWDNVNKVLYFRDTGTVEKKEATGVVTDEQEETLILLRTMKFIRMCVKKRNHDNTILERRFEIKCNLAKYEENNVSLRKRHPAIFRNQEYIFVPSNDMVLSMPFVWVETLRDNQWTKLNKIWKKQTDETLQRAQQQSIVSIRLYSRMFCDDANIDPTSRLIFQIALEKTPKTFMYVKLEQIDELLGDQPWMKGDMNTLANVGSGCLVNVSWGARKKTSKTNGFLSVGAIVEVRNHGSKGACYFAEILSLNDKTAEVKWTSSGRKELVKYSDCYIMDDSIHSSRKRQKTDRFAPETQNKPDETDILPETTMLPGQISNKYYCFENLTKKCAEGAIANLLNMLGFNEEEINLFWKLSRDSVENLSGYFGDGIPKKVHKSNVVDSIQRSLWILRKKFGFNTTSALKKEKVTGVTRTFEFLERAHFPMLIGVKSDQAAYEHVVVVWNKRIIDYESMYTMPLTLESISHLCGSTTKFRQLTCGYGLIPPKTHRPITDHNNFGIEWGLTELYHGTNDGVRGYFH